MDSLLRYFDMLCLIPKAPHSISTPELQEKLQSTGYEVDLRTVQRDLIKLSASPLFPITSTEGTKPLRWFWMDNVSPMQFPLMSTDEALTFKLAENFLEPLLPPSVRSRLTSYFQLADARLHESKFDCWADKVRIVSNNLTLLPPEIKPSILVVVYDAVLNNRRFHGTYQAIYKSPKTYEINPLGLVFRHNLIYLVATIGDYNDIKQLALHRFHDATFSDRIVRVPDGFNLDDYIAHGEFDLPFGDDIELTLKINSFMKQLLSETPLSETQSIQDVDDDYSLIHAIVKDTGQLRWWIQSFGSSIEVIKPVDLREYFAQEARALMAMYL
jgi:predicted DNA-binding transcriptional regulator YafY